MLDIELQRALIDALAHLPKATRTAMALRYYKGLTPTEIAMRSSVSTNTVKSQLRRGLEAMRGELDRKHGGDRDRWTLGFAPLIGHSVPISNAADHPVALNSAAVQGIAASIMMTTTKWMAVGTVGLLGAIAALLWTPRGEGESALRSAAIMDSADDLVSPAREDASSQPSLETASAAAERELGGERAERTAIISPSKYRPALIVRDARSGEGIERFTLVSRDMGNDRLRDQGQFFAPGGRLTSRQKPGLNVHGRGDRSFTVWASGYAASSVISENFGPSREVVIELDPGAVPTLRGVVLNRGVPVADAVVALCAYRRINWKPSELSAVVETKTGPRGDFELGAAEGHYVLRVNDDAGSSSRQVELPATERMLIDLADLGSLTVSVHDADGEPLPNIISIVRSIDSNGRDDRMTTDDEGRAVFANLESGNVRVSLHGTQERFHNLPVAVRDVELVKGADLEIEITAPNPEEPRRARLIVEGGTPEGWYAQRYGSQDWTAAATSGELDIGLNDGTFVSLRSPEGAVWTWMVPPFEAEEFLVEIRIPRARSQYRGHVLSRVDGGPIICDVYCSMTSGDSRFTRLAAATDERGYFVLPVPTDEITTIKILIDGRSGDDWFTPTHAPSASPPLELHVFENNSYRTDPGMPRASVRGKVTDGRDGSAIVGGSVWIRAIYDGPHGAYEVASESSRSTTDLEGNYFCRVAAADRYAVRAWRRISSGSMPDTTVEKGRLSDGEVVVWDLVLPIEEK